MTASEFLHSLTTGQPCKTDGHVVILGGGEEAVDAARSAVRLGAKRVTLVWEKGRKAMPCFGELIDAAAEEGMRLQLNSRPLRIEKYSSSRYRVICWQDGEELILEASSVILASRRAVDLEFLQSLGLEVSQRALTVDRNTLATSMNGVFAAGEVISGRAPVVRAVRSGRLAAMSINAHLRGLRFSGEARLVNVRMDKLTDQELDALHDGFERRPREQQKVLLPDARRATFDEVMFGLQESEAVWEASRCLQCDCLAKDACKLREYATQYGASPRTFRGARRMFERDTSHPEVIYEAGKCIMCGLCVRIAAQSGERPGIAFLGRGFTARAGVPFDGTVAEGLPTVAVRCALACPTGALGVRPNSKNPTD